MFTEFLMYNFLMFIAFFCLIVIHRMDYNKKMEEIDTILLNHKAAAEATIELYTKLIGNITNAHEVVINNKLRVDEIQKTMDEVDQYYRALQDVKFN